MKKVLAGYMFDQTGLEITKEDAQKLTHLMVAFGKIEHGRILTGHLPGLDRMQQIREWNPSIKILLSLVGGGEASFSEGSSTEENRHGIAVSCADTIRSLGFDGIDLDWEYPCCSENFISACPEDKRNFTLLCEEIRMELDGAGEEPLLLTIAAGADQYYIQNTQMDQVQKYLDYVFVMTYDLRCGFHTLTGHHTNLYTATGDLNRTSADAAVRLFEKAGVPKNKIVLGAAMYSRMWKNVEDRNHGFLQLTEAAGGYGPVYHDLVKDYVNKNGYIRYWDDEAKAPYLFNGSTFLSYDDPQSLRCKCDYVKQQGLAGIFYWEHGGDSTRELLNTMASCISNG